MAFYAESDGCPTYDGSRIKDVVDGWSGRKFTNSELKIVDGYSARLITLNELLYFDYEWYEHHGRYSIEKYWEKTDNTPTWVYNSNYLYWTMSQYNGDSYGPEVWVVSNDGNLNMARGFNTNGVVRPVINVYKSKIAS